MRRTPRTLGLLAVTALLTVPACSGDDDADPAPSVPAATSDADEPADPADEPADEPTEEPADETSEEPADEPTEEPADETSEEPAAEPTEEPADETSGEPADDGDTVFVTDISDLPDECVELVTDMLQEIEPVVSQIDWESASLDDLDTLMVELEDEFEALDDVEQDAGCARYEFEDDTASFDAMLELAEEEAPGAVGWLTFIRDMFSAFPGSGEEPSAEGAPADCESAIAYLEEVIAGGGTMSSLPLSEVTAVSQAFTVVTTDCDAATMSEFVERDDVSAFLS